MSQKAVKKLRREIRRRLDAEKKLLDVNGIANQLIEAVEALQPKGSFLGFTIFKTADVKAFYSKVSAWVKKYSTPSKS